MHGDDPREQRGEQELEAAPREDGEGERERDVDERALDLVHRLRRRRRPEERSGGPDEQHEPGAEVCDLERPSETRSWAASPIAAAQRNASEAHPQVLGK